MGPRPSKIKSKKNPPSVKTDLLNMRESVCQTITYHPKEKLKGHKWWDFSLCVQAKIWGQASYFEVAWMLPFLGWGQIACRICVDKAKLLQILNMVQHSPVPITCTPHLTMNLEETFWLCTRKEWEKHVFSIFSGQLLVLHLAIRYWIFLP